MKQPPEENGYPRARPRLPTGIVIASVVVALVAVSGLIALLYRETRGPGEILREFARRVDEGDCAGSYDLVAQSVRSGLAEDQWCERLSTVDEQIDADFELERAVLMGDEATVFVSGPPAGQWLLERHGERSWRVLGPPEGFGA
jgi:hypothetical protein